MNPFYSRLKTLSAVLLMGLSLGVILRAYPRLLAVETSLPPASVDLILSGSAKCDRTGTP